MIENNALFFVMLRRNGSAAGDAQDTPVFVADDEDQTLTLGWTSATRLNITMRGTGKLHELRRHYQDLEISLRDAEDP